MKRIGLFFVLAALLATAGCKNGVMGIGGPKTPDITGKWKGEIQMPEASKDDPMAKLGQAMGQMMLGNLTLEFLPGDKFRLTMMGMPIEGSYTRDGNELAMKAESAMGMSAAELKKQDPKFNSDMLKATVSEDGTKITVRSENARASEGEMVFNRYTEEAKKETASTVSNAEKNLVGSYSCELKADRPEKMTPQEESEWKMGEALMKSASLDLHADNTFKIVLMLEMTGTWKVEGDEVKLHMTGMAGMPDDGKSGDKNDMNLRIDPNGRLTMAEKGPKGQTMAFVKK